MCPCWLCGDAAAITADGLEGAFAQGIVPPEAVPRLHPLWSGATPPRMRGDEGSQRRIVAAWEAGECVIVRGRLLSDAVLHVEQVIGPC